MIYFDHAASTPLDPDALGAMKPTFDLHFGNPSSLYAMGRDAHGFMDRAREQVALTLNADPKEIVFTSGGTEAVNAALKGVAWALRERGSHLIISAVEHHCVLDACAWLARQGFQITQVPVDSSGRVDPNTVEKALRAETILVSIMAANNEVGTIQPFREIGKTCRSRKVLFHTDAVQAYGKLLIDVERDFVDLLSVSGHKIHGPKGSGFLFQRRGVELAPLVHGGGQERGRRGGTENVAGAVGLGEAAAKACHHLTGEKLRLNALTQILWDGLKKRLPEIELVGPASQEERLPGLLNLHLPGIEGETLVHGLDAKGFAVSTGAACATGGGGPSHVLLAMGRTKNQAKEAVRVSLGKSNTEAEVRQLLEVLPLVADRLKAMSTMWLDEDSKT